MGFLKDRASRISREEEGKWRASDLRARGQADENSRAVSQISDNITVEHYNDPRPTGKIVIGARPDQVATRRPAVLPPYRFHREDAAAAIRALNYNVESGGRGINLFRDVIKPGVDWLTSWGRASSETVEGYLDNLLNGAAANIDLRQIRNFPGITRPQIVAAVENILRQKTGVNGSRSVAEFIEATGRNELLTIFSYSSRAETDLGNLVQAEMLESEDQVIKVDLSDRAVWEYGYMMVQTYGAHQNFSSPATEVHFSYAHIYSGRSSIDTREGIFVTGLSLGSKEAQKVRQSLGINLSPVMEPRPHGTRSSPAENLRDSANELALRVLTAASLLSQDQTRAAGPRFEKKMQVVPEAAWGLHFLLMNRCLPRGMELK